MSREELLDIMKFVFLVFLDFHQILLAEGNYLIRSWGGQNDFSVNIVVRWAGCLAQYQKHNLCGLIPKLVQAKN